MARFEPSDPAPLDARSRAEAEARVGAARATLRRARADAERSQAELEFAEAELQRSEGLAQANIVSNEAFESTGLAANRARKSNGGSCTGGE